MTNAPEGAGTPIPASPREQTITAALFQARSRHGDECDDFAPTAGEMTDGDQLVYCEACRRVLLRWGGSDG